MKKLVLILVVGLFFVNYYKAQNTFSTFYTNPFYEYGGSHGFSVHVYEDTIMVVGFTHAELDSVLTTAGYMWKYDLQGNLLDTLVFPSSNIDFLGLNFGRYGGNIFKNHHLIMPYSEFNNSNPELGGDSLVKMDLAGNNFWIKNISIDSTRRHLYRKAIEHQGGFTVVGTILDSIHFTGYAGQRGIVTHTDTLGNVEWYQTYADISEMFYAAPTIDGGLILSGGHYVNQLGDTFDASIIKTDSLGQEMWRHHFGDEESEGWDSPIIQLKDGSYLIFTVDIGLEEFGTFRGPYWVKRLIDDPSSENGYSIIQDKKWDWRDFGRNLRGVKQLEDSNIVVIGSNGRHHPETGVLNTLRGYIMKMDNNLDSLWSHFYGYTEEHVLGYHILTDFEIMPDNGFIITGFVKYPSNHPIWPSVEQMWLLRLDEYGCLEPGCQYVGIEEINIGLENTMLVYPNPVVYGGEINIRFSPQGVAEMPYAKDETQLAIYDALGREVHRQVVPATGSNDAFDILLNIPELAKGNYSIQWYSDKWFDAVQFNYE